MRTVVNVKHQKQSESPNLARFTRIRSETALTRVHVYSGNTDSAVCEILTILSYFNFFIFLGTKMLLYSQLNKLKNPLMCVPVHKAKRKTFTYAGLGVGASLSPLLIGFVYTGFGLHTHPTSRE